MANNLIEYLKQIPDRRTTDGRRHPQWLVLLLVIMGTMNGAVGNRAIGDFVKRHQSALIEKFGIKKHGVPSYSTIRRVMMGVSTQELIAAFNRWAREYIEVTDKDWCGLDGKSIKGTVANSQTERQNFVSIVSLFAGERGVVIGVDKFENKDKSEIEVVQELVSALDLTGIVLTLDSLHCQKKLVS